MKEIPFKEVLFIVRKRFRFSLEELAEASGLSPSYISMIETGKRPPSEDAMSSLGRGLIKLIDRKMEEDEREQKRFLEQMRKDFASARERDLQELQKLTKGNFPGMSAEQINQLVGKHSE